MENDGKIKVGAFDVVTTPGHENSIWVQVPGKLCLNIRLDVSPAGRHSVTAYAAKSESVLDHEGIVKLKITEDK